MKVAVPTGVGVLLALGGCAGPRRYEPPPDTTPSALLKARIVHHEWPGSHCFASIRVDDVPLVTEARAQVRCDITDATLIAIRNTPVKLATNFWEVDLQGNQRSVGGCTEKEVLVPKADGIYLLQVDYHGDHSCTLRCFVQTDGAFVPCGPEEDPFGWADPNPSSERP